MELNENKNTLTDEQLEEVIDTLEESKSEDEKRLEEILKSKKEELEDETSELDSEVVNVVANSETGQIEHIIPATNDENDNNSTIEEALEDTSNLTEEEVEEGAKNYNLSDEDAKKLIDIVMNYKVRKNSESLYEQLPDPIKEYVDTFYNNLKAEGKKVSKNSIARYFLDEFIVDMTNNRELIDLQKAIEKELEIPSIVDMYSEHIKEIMEVKLIETADKLEEEHPEKAKALRDISAMFKDSYTFGLMKSTLINDNDAKNKIRESVYDYNKYCNRFNYKIESISIKINDVFLVGKTLKRLGIPVDDIKKFVVLFCKTCDKMDVNNVVHVSYMYYTIKNILALDHTSEAKTEFSKQLIANILSLIDYINEVQQNVESTMPEKLLKAKIKRCNKKRQKGNL